MVYGPLTFEDFVNQGKSSIGGIPEEEPSASELVVNKRKIPKSLKRHLQKVAEYAIINGQGIHDYDFISCFEDVTQHSLILHELGYRSLSDLLDDVPDLFIRKPLPLYPAEYIIYPVSNFGWRVEDNMQNLEVMEHFAVSLLLDHIVLKIKKLLEAHPEGIKVEEIEQIYNINCKDALVISELGFDSFETFLSSIVNRLPFKFFSIDSEKFIQLIKPNDLPSGSDITSFNVTSEAFEEVVPIDAAIPNFLYKPQTFPSNSDFTALIPVCVSTVEHPGHLYVQLVENDDFQSMIMKLEDFYCGNESEQYIMKPCHIKVGASCIAKSLMDCQWYRAQIISFPSPQSVLVQFVDAGNKEIVNKSLLRYAKKEFIEIPAQAIKCQLAFVKLPKNAIKWHPEATNRILSLCADMPMMAQVKGRGVDNSYIVALSDTNGEEHVYIHEILCEEGFAELDIHEPYQNIPDSQENSQNTSHSSESNENIPESPEHNQNLPDSHKLKAETDPVYHHSLDTLPEFPARDFLEKFTHALPSASQSDTYVQLLRKVLSEKPNPVHQKADSLETNLPSHFNPFPPGMSYFAYRNPDLVNLHHNISSLLRFNPHFVNWKNKFDKFYLS